MIGVEQSSQSVDWGNPINREHSLNFGRVAWWIAAPVFQGGDRWVDLVFRRNPRIISASPTTRWSTNRFATDGVWGDVQFGGTEDRAGSVGPSLNGLTGGSIAVTFRTASGLSSGYMLSLPNSTFGGNGFDLHFTGTTTIRSWLSASGGSSGISATHTYGGAGWQRIVATYDGKTHKLYINGREVATTAKTGTINHASGMVFIGNFSDDFNSLASGNYAEVSVWNRGLDPSEVWQDYQLGRQWNREILNRWTDRFFAVDAKLFNPAWARGSNVILPGAMA